MWPNTNARFVAGEGAHRRHMTSRAYAFMFSMGRLTSKVSSGAMFFTCQTSSRIAQMARRSVSELAMVTSVSTPVFERLGEHALEPRAIVFRIAAQRLGDGVERRTARERRAVLRRRRGVVVVVVAPQRFECRELAAEAESSRPNSSDQRIETRQRRQHGLLAARARHQAQLGARDHAQRAFAADEQLLEVIARRCS